MAADLDEAAGTELDALDGLGSLLDKSLVRQADATDGDRTPRVVDARDDQGVRDRACSTRSRSSRPRPASTTPRYFAQLADRCRDDRRRPTRTIGSRRRSTTSASPGATALATHDLARLTRCATALWPIYERRGWYHATLELIDDLLGVLATTPDSPERWEQELSRC